MTRAVDIGVAGLLASGLLALYFEPLSAMVRQWNASPMYSYAFTVPLISLYLLWSRRQERSKRQPRPARLSGAAVVAVALLLLALGQVAAIQIVQQLSILVALVGLVLFLFGAEYLKVSAPALGYLLFMFPIWDVFTEPLQGPFRNNSAAIGVGLLHAVGIPAYREGTTIALSNVTLEVARACSGVNYLIAVLALAMPLSYLRLRGIWRHAALIGSALVIAALANGLRVGLIGALAYLEIGSPLHGPFHVLHGLFVAGVGYAALFAGLHLLEGRGSSPDPAAPPAPAVREVPFSWRPGEASVMAVLFWTLVFVGTSPRSVPVALAMPLEQLPGELGAWHADPARAAGSKDVIAWDDADTQLRRRYYRHDGQSATVDIWYFEAQRQDREIVNFKAAGLHTGAVARAIPVRTGAPFSANVVRFPEELGLFWYVLDGEPEADQYVAKLRSLWTAVTAHQSNGAAVMVRAPSSALSEDVALATLSDLAAEVQAALGRHWQPGRPVARASSSRAK